jgi:hypothetical protein
VPKQEPLKIIFIEWLDSCGSSGWRPLAEIQTSPALCQSVGFLVAETKDAITVALNRTRSDGNVPFGECMAIPKIAIKRKKVISLR